jgi:predicted PurR-regulated permease PerM
MEMAEPQKTHIAGFSSPATFTNRVLIIAAIAVLALVAWRLSSVFVLLFAGVVLALVFRAMSDPLARLLGIGSRWALAIVILLIIAFLGAGIWFLGDRIVAQFGQIETRIPEAWKSIRGWIEQNQIGRFILDSLDTTFAGADSEPGRLARLATTTFGAIADAAIIVVLGVYFAAEPGLYYRGLLKLLPPRARPQADAALAAAHHALHRWLRGQALAMLSIGVMTGVGLWALGIPMALALGILAGLLEFIPYIGPIASAVPAILVAFAKSPMDALYVLLLYIAVQQFEGNVLVPAIEKWAVRLAPVLTIIAVVIAGLLFGILGVIVATPLMIVVMVLVQKLYVEGTLGDKA